MGGFLGAIAGVGMLVLIGALFFTFLHQTGAVNRKQMQRLGVAACMTLGTGMIYWLLGGLFYGVGFEPVAGIAEINAIFRTAGLEKMYSALEKPHFFGFFSGIFAFLGHGLGKILFECYLLAGVVLANVMTITANCLLLSRLEKMIGKMAAEKCVFLLLCLPGALFFFLPGCAPLVLLLAAIAFFFVGKKMPARELFVSESVYSWMIGISGMLSAAVVFGAVMGTWA